jgi:hypothetical protein
VTFPAESAENQWRALAARISGRGRMRVSRDGGRTYPLRGERDITDKLPNQPAAVLIFDTGGCAKTFCIDLDASRGGSDAVERDFRALRAILSRFGCAHFADRSPNGGIHVYVPLAEPLPYPEAVRVANALAARTPTMDPMPMLGIQSGCIRPPGARHKTGGHQQLLDSLNAAWKATQEPTTVAAWQGFTNELGTVEPDVTPATEAGNVEHLRPLGRHSDPDGDYQSIARTGAYDATRYRSPSEARQAVIWSAVAAGWQLVDVAQRLENGTWPGLAAMYARYRPNSRHDALVRDWNRAVRFEKQRRTKGPDSSVRVGTTSGPKTHRAGVYQEIRTWANAVDYLYREGRNDDLATRAVLYALGEAAMKTGSLEVEFGNRSLAIATGLDQATVGKCLKRLAAEDRPLIELLNPARGIKAHLWQLRLDPDLQSAVEKIAWKPGKIHGIRPPFRELGHTAAFVYAVLERHSTALSGRAVATGAGLSPAAAHDALQILAAFGLADRSPTGWTVGKASLQQLAEQFGIVDIIRAQIARYRAERITWWARLGIVRLNIDGQSVGFHDTRPPPPPDNYIDGTLMDLLEAELGATLIERSA